MKKKKNFIFSETFLETLKISINFPISIINVVKYFLSTDLIFCYAI